MSNLLYITQLVNTTVDRDIRNAQHALLIIYKMSEDNLVPEEHSSLNVGISKLECVVYQTAIEFVTVARIV